MAWLCLLLVTNFIAFIMTFALCKSEENIKKADVALREFVVLTICVTVESLCMAGIGVEHGALMAISTGLCPPLAVLVLKYMKE